MEFYADDIVRTMGFEFWYNNSTDGFDIKTPCGELIYQGDMLDQERVAQEFFFKLAREVFLK